MRQWNRLILTGLLAMSLVTRTTPQPAGAATQVAAPAANPGIQYKLVYNNVAGAFEVYMKPDTTLVMPYQLGYAQITLKAPPGFVISAGPTATAGINWSNTSTNRTADTGLSSDYFGIEATSFPNNTPAWTAGTEVKMFTFSSSTCLGALSIIVNNTDPIFGVPNLSPANSIVVDPTYGELYDGNYAGSGGLSASCFSPDVTTSVGQPSPSLAVGQASSVPITITNSGQGPATGPLTSTVTLPAGVSAPASFSNNGWSCTTASQTVTCINAGPIAPGSSSTFSVPATPDISTVGTQPQFNATTAPVPGEANTINNVASPLTPTTAVAGGTAPTISAPGSSSTTGDTTPTISGIADPGSTVTVYRGGSPICTAIASGTGAFSCTPLSPLPAGATTISVTAQLGSYVSPPATRSFTIDTTAPTAPTVVTPTENLPTSDTTPTFAGVAEPGSMVTVTVGGTPVCSAQADLSGNWTCTPVTPLSSGPQTALVTATDPAGNISPTTARNLTVDSTAPIAPVVTSPAVSATVGSTTPPISGSAEPGSTVTVKDGATVICTAVVDGAGNWTCMPSTPLSNGPHSLTTTTTDPAGNTGPASAPRSITVDTVAPAVPVVVTPTETFKTNDNTPIVTGTAEPGSTVTVKEGATTLCTAVADATGNWSCTTSTLSDGPHTVLVNATDPAGNAGPAATRNFSVDSTAPAGPGITSPVTQTADSTPAIGGTAEPGSTMTVKDGATVLCIAVADASGNWSCSPSTALGEGPHTVTAIATDPASNTSPIGNPKTFTVDTTAPTAPNVTAPVEGSTTSNQTPTLAGTAEPGSTVTVKDGPTTICTVVADASGNWNCTSTPLTNGTHTLTTTATDPAGNTSPADTQTVTINNSVAAVINAPTVGQPVSDTTPTIGGTGTPSGTVVVKDGATTICTTTVDATGNWSCTPSTPLSSGAHSLIATVTDSGGGSMNSPARSFTIDNAAPIAPTVISPTNGSTTANTTPLIAGTAEPGSTVSVTDGGAPVCTAIADASGNWSCSPSTPLVNGAHALAVTATDPAGNISAPTTRPFTVDTVAPTAPIVTAPTAGSPISNTTPTLSGNAEPGSTVTVRDGPGGPVLCTSVVGLSGTWTCTPSTPLTQGPHTLSTTATDPTGNTSAPVSTPVTIDTTAPIAPTTLSPAANAIVSDTTPTISGTGEPSSTIKVTDGPGGLLVCTAVVDASGNWTCTPPYILGDGSHALTLTATDPAGNTSTVATRPITVDGSLPLAPTVSAPAPSQVISDTTPTLSGTSEPSSTVTIKDGPTTVCTAVADTNGNWTCTPSTPLTNGPHSLTATVTDPAGNTSPASSPVNVTVDNAAPTTPVISAPTANSTTSSNTPVISGTAEPGSVIEITENDLPVCMATANISGVWSCTPSIALGNGSHTLVTSARDAAGNTSPVATRTFSISNVAPSLIGPTPGSVLTDTTPAFTGTGTPGGQVTVTTSPTGTLLCTTTIDASGNWTCTPATPLSQGPQPVVATISNPGGTTTTPPITFGVDSTVPVTPTISAPTAGQSTNDSTPAFSGTAEPGSTVKVTEGGVTLCSAVADASGHWTCTPSLPLADGSHNLSVTTTDPAGNTSPSTPITLGVDTVAPATPSVISPTASAPVSDTTPTFGGTGVPSDTITVRDGPTGPVLCTTVVDASGNWSCTPAAPMTDGPHAIAVIATDPAGNAGPVATRPITVDSAIPAAPSLTQPATNALIGGTTQPVFVGTAEPGATVVVKDGATVLCTAVADAGGNWTCTPSTPLAQGPHAITVAQTDTAGNIGPIGTPRTITIDTVAPTAPVVTVPAAGGTTNDNTPTIAGTAEPSSTVKVTEGPGGPVLCTAVADASGHWTCDVTTPLPNGSHVLNVSVTDPAGNVSPTTAQVFNVSNTAPSLISPTPGQPISDTTPTYVGTGTPGGLVTVTTSPTGTVLCTATIDASGNWTCTPVTPLTDGATSVVAIISNPGGITTTPPVSFTVDTSAPLTPTLTAPTVGSTTGDTTPTFSGTAEPGSTVKVTDGGTVLCTAVVDASGHWTCTPTQPQVDGPHTVKVTVTDPAGNTSSALTQTYTTDTVAPAAPVVGAPAPGSTTGDTTPTLSGTAEPSATVTIKENGVVLCTTVADASGNWTCTLAIPLADGTHNLVVNQTDPAGNAGPTTTVSVKIDTVAPVAPTITAPVAGSTTATSLPLFSGTAEPGSTVLIKEDGATLCMAVATASGNWTCQPVIALSNGPHTVTATATDPTGNASPVGAPVAFNVNNGLPTGNLDSDGDGILDSVECPHGLPCPDSDRDGKPDYLDTDGDNDGIPDSVEGTKDTDGDGIPDRLENNQADTDGDGIPNYKDTDDDGDGIPTASEDLNHDGDLMNDDADHDGIPAYLDANDAGVGPGDTDNDGVSDATECPGGAPCPDSDGDGIPDYADPDSDNDGIPDSVEGPKDTDGDGIPDRLENNYVDTDGDGLPNFKDTDDDGDGIPTRLEDLNGDGNLRNDDADHDGIPAYLDPNDHKQLAGGGDSDGDGIPDSLECTGINTGMGVAIGCVINIINNYGTPPPYMSLDSDSDGIPDAVEGNKDTDGDGIPDRLEPNNLDSDGDGKPNYLDSDDDGDGIPTVQEDLNHDGNLANDDADHDGIPAYLDPNDAVKQPNGGDSDGDSIPDNQECSVGTACPDTDGDGLPDYLDPDGDGDGILDAVEGTKDTDGDGIPDRMENNLVDSDGDGKPNFNDSDDDGDGIPTASEDLNGDKKLFNDDADRDGIPAYLDPNDHVKQGDGTPLPGGGDSDGDGIPDNVECISGSVCVDSDGDGKPDYLDTDGDGDGVLDVNEGVKDSDGDGIPDRLENNKLDSDGDGKPNNQDADDDGDGIPTASEDVNGDKNWLNDDADHDGVPAYLDPNDGQGLAGGGDSDGDGISDKVECPAGTQCADTDGDGKPDYLDTDSDGDGTSDATEGTKDTDGDGLPDRSEPNTVDTDGDGKPNVNDPDDDGDGIPTASEDLNHDGNWMNDDPNGNGIPASLDAQDKGVAKPMINPINGGGFNPNGLVGLSGTAAPGSTVTVSEGGIPLCTAVANAAGVWTCNTSLNPGEHTLIATDSNNVASNPTTITLTVRAFIYIPIMKVAS